jgi:molybdopterin-dependent oxidoreductase alpha subunit
MKHVFSEAGVIRGTRALLRVNQKEGFDCPGCAWPDPDDRRSLVEFCENGAKAVAEEATTLRMTPEIFAARSIRELASLTDFEIGKLGRLTHPMILREGDTHYRPLDWDMAFETIADALTSLDSPDEATFYTSGRTSNEAAFLYQLFVRLFGTNNLPDCSNMCHESSGTALMESIGVGKGTVTLEDFDHADCILVIGQNPGTNHPRMLTALQRAARNGCKIISVNPLMETGLKRFKHPQEVLGLLGPGTPIASLFVPVRINGDVALLKGILKELLAAEDLAPGTVFDHEFIRAFTVGYERFIADLRETSWESVIEESGIGHERIAEAAEIIRGSKRLIACWAMGLTQHKNAVANIQEVVNLLLLGGHLGRPGAGACPVRGHSNVQGDRTMGIYEKMPDSFLDALGAEFGFAPPRRHGFDTVDSIKAMHDGRLKIFFGMGGNFLSASPDTELVAEALRRCRLTVQVSTKLNRGHLVTGKTALILPCLGRSEEDLRASGPQLVTVEDSMGVIRASQGKLKQGSPHLRSEVAIVAGLAQAVFRRRPEILVPWAELAEDYGLIRARIARVVPGFEGFAERIAREKSFHLPHPVRDRREFRTASGRAEFKVHPIAVTRLEPGRFLLMTIRSHDQFNTTIYGLNDRYRGITHGRRVVLMNGEDISRAGFSEGELVDIVSHFGDETRQAPRFRVVAYEIPRRCVAAYYPEANVLVPIGSTADKSNTPAYKSIEVSLRRSAGG